MIVLDASVLIAHLDRRDAHHTAAKARLLELATEPFGVGSVTLTEVLVGPSRDGHLAAAEAALRDLRITELPLPPNCARELAALRVETALKLPDCCVLLAAEAASGHLVTFDGRLERAARRRGIATG